METGLQATRIAALLWGKDDDNGGLTFKQPDTDKVVAVADHYGPLVPFIYQTGIREDHGQAIRCLSVSDANKDLLLKTSGFLPTLIDGLLLDPDHPTRSDGKTNFKTVAPAVQRDFAEAIAQLAMYQPGREALLEDPAVAEALRQVAEEGWTEEARHCAQSALTALAGRQPDRAESDQDKRHVMLSYQWVRVQV